MLTNVTIAVRHPIMRRGIASIVGDSPAFHIAGEAGDLLTLNDLCANTKPSVILIDSALISTSKDTSVRELAENFPQARVIMLWLYERPSEQQRQLAPFNVELINQNPVALNREIVKALESEIPATFAQFEYAEAPTLTPRETEVLEYIGRGLSTSEIAIKLDISPRTAELHRYRICRKIGANSSLDLAKYLIRQGYLPI